MKKYLYNNKYGISWNKSIPIIAINIYSAVPCVMTDAAAAAVRGVCSLSIHRVTGNYRAMVLFARFYVLLPSMQTIAKPR